MFIKKYFNDIHIGSIFIFLGTLFLFAGNSKSLLIAENYFLFTLAIAFNILGFIFNHKNKFDLSFLTLLCLYVLLSTIIFISIDKYDEGAALSLILYCVLVISSQMVNYTKKDLNIIVSGIVFSSLLFSFLILLFGKEYAYIGSAKYTFVQFFGNKIEFEPNYLAAFLFIGLVLCYFKIEKTENKFNIYTHTFISLIILIGILLTGSRSAYICSALFFVLLFIFSKNKNIKKILTILLIIGIIAAPLLITFNIIPSNIIQKILNLNLSDNSNRKRVLDWIYGIKTSFINPFFGQGPVQTFELIKELFNFNGDAHNTFITFAIYYGIPFLCAILILITSVLIKLKQNNEIVLWVLLLVFLIEMNILALQFFIGLWLLILVILTEQRIKKRV